MPVDDDDAAAILLHYAIRDLDAACRQLAQPEVGWLDWCGLVVAVLTCHPATWAQVEQVCLSAARRITAEIHASL